MKGFHKNSRRIENEIFILKTTLQHEDRLGQRGSHDHLCLRRKQKDGHKKAASSESEKAPNLQGDKKPHYQGSKINGSLVLSLEASATSGGIRAGVLVS
ncbi:hypothetical protein YC2023_075873 [Brassica napus]